MAPVLGGEGGAVGGGGGQPDQGGPTLIVYHYPSWTLFVAPFIRGVQQSNVQVKLDPQEMFISERGRGTRILN